ncbi:MAG: hypothetical protein ACRCXB_20765 [Aeromonadaceae bacterium]
MKDYLKMADVFDCEVESDADLMFSYSLGNIADFSGYKSQCRYSAHAINSHDELVQMNNELLGIINRIIDTSTEMEGKDVSSSWSEGYKQCSIDTGKAISEMLCRIEGGEK